MGYPALNHVDYLYVNVKVNDEVVFIFLIENNLVSVVFLNEEDIKVVSGNINVEMDEQKEAMT